MFLLDLTITSTVSKPIVHSRTGAGQRNRELSYRDRMEHQKLIAAAKELRPLFDKAKVILGKGAGHRQEGRREVLNVSTLVNESHLNVSANLNEGRRSELIVTVFHHTNKPVSFNGVPIVLTPTTREQRCDRSSTPIEVKLEGTNKKGEFRAVFLDLEQGNYTLRVGDPNFTVFGNVRN